MISILTRTYNRPRELLDRCIPSVLAQPTDWEMLVVGDGTDDETVRGMQQATKDTRIRFWNRERPQYPSDRRQTWHIQGVHALQFALAKARGEWIVILDDDDELLPHALPVLEVFAKTFPSDVVYGQSETYKHGKPTGQLYGFWPPSDGHPAPGAYMYRRSLNIEPRAVLETPFDTDLWSRFIAARARFTYIPAVIHRFHRGHP